jgi:hypothetical protein
MLDYTVDVLMFKSEISPHEVAQPQSSATLETGEANRRPHARHSLR